MLVVIPDSYKEGLVVENVNRRYGTQYSNEVDNILIAYFAMLSFSMKTMMKPPLVEVAVMNTISIAKNIIGSRTERRINRVMEDYELEINRIVDNLINKSNEWRKQ